MRANWTDSDVERIARAFATCALPKPEWTHAAHFAVAFWLLADPRIDAFAALPSMIRAYNSATGVANSDSSGYHETITLASLRAARAWMNAHGDEPLAASLRRFLASGYDASGWLLRYWSRERLFSVDARRTWVEPDLGPLPF